MIKSMMLLVLSSSYILATPINLPDAPPDFPFIGSIHQRIQDSDLLGTRFFAGFGEHLGVSCSWDSMINGGCSEFFTVSMIHNGPNFNLFSVRNTSGQTMTDFRFDGITLDHKRQGHFRLGGKLGIDLPDLGGGTGTYGSGRGHDLFGDHLLSIDLLNKLSGDLYGSVAFKTNVAGGDAMLVGWDSDRLIASPEPASMLLVGGGIAGLAWFKRRKLNQRN